MIRLKCRECRDSESCLQIDCYSTRQVELLARVHCSYYDW